MPEFLKLSPEQLDRIASGKKKPGVRQQIREEYQGFLREIEPGEGGQLLLSEGDNRLTIRNRLKAAAKELGKRLVFIRSGDNVIRFRIEDGTQAQESEAVLDHTPQEEPAFEMPPPASAPEAAPAAPRRGRRKSE